MRRYSLRNRIKIGMVIGLTLFVSVGLVRINPFLAPVQAGGEPAPCTEGTVVAKSGNDIVGATDPLVLFSTDGGTTFTEQAFIVAPLVDPPFSYDKISASSEYVAINPDRSAPHTDPPFVPGTSIPQYFQTKFQVPQGCNNPTLTVAVNADNVATVFLNGTQIGMQVDLETVNNFQNPPDLFTSSGPFLPGDNTLTFRVGNYTNQLALDFEARICCTEVSTCRTCNEGVVVVDQNVTVDLNPVVPTCSGDPDLCAFLTFTRVGTISNWKAIFDVGANRLLIKNGATVTVKPGPPNGGNNKESPGIVIKSTCDIEIEKGGAVVVQSINKQAGDILIQANGNITIGGIVSNSVTGTNGRPGNVTIASCCGGIRTGPSSVIETSGVDFGGSDINLVACGGGETPGNIAINGLVDASYKAAPASTINIAAFNGFVAIDGTNFLGVEAGTQRPITSGVTVRSRRDPVAGTIKIQANNDITVLGNRVLDKIHPNFGAVAVKPTSTNGTSGDGAIVAVSVNGRIVAKDRAFDIANRFNALNDITLFAAGNIDLSVTASIDDGAADNTKPVVNSQGGSAGKGGKNTLRSYSGGILIGPKAQVLANFVGTPGSNGTNLLTSCTGVTNNGTVNPADLVPGDDSGVCAPPAPDPLFAGCGSFNVCGRNGGN